MAKKIAKSTTAAPKKKEVARASTATIPPPLNAPDARVLDRLWATVLSRKDASPSESHSARLLARKRWNA